MWPKPSEQEKKKNLWTSCSVEGKQKEGTGCARKVDKVRMSWEEKTERPLGESGWGEMEIVKERTGGGRKRKKEDEQTNASLGNRCNQLRQSAND